MLKIQLNWGLTLLHFLSKHFIASLIVVCHRHADGIKRPFCYAALGETLRHFQVACFPLEMSVKMLHEVLSMARVGNSERLVRWGRDDDLPIFPKEFRMPVGYERIKFFYSNSIQRL